MRALTLSQPWATLHVAPCSLTNDQPAKRVESRSWRIFLGQTAPDLKPQDAIAIHAGKGIDKDLRDQVSNRKQFVEPFASLLRACGFSATDPWRSDYWDILTHVQPGGPWFSTEEGLYVSPLPLGEIIGVTHYYDIVPGIEVRNMVDRGELPAHELELGNYRSTPEEKRWGFLSRDALLFEHPIACRGFQQFWRVPHLTAALVWNNILVKPVAR